MDIEKDMKSENGMSETLPKFSESDISKTNISSFGLDNMDFFDIDSSTISEFMSLSLNAKIAKFNSNFSYRKLKDKNSSNTFLHYICMNDDNYPMMNLIKPTIKEMDSRNNQGQTPLHISLINKNYKISTYLIKNGANVNLSDNNLDTSLHLAVKYGNPDIAKLLIEFRANPFLLNKNKETALDLAVKLNNKECINLLKDISLMNETDSNTIQQNSNKKINLKQNINKKNIINGNDNIQKYVNNDNNIININNIINNDNIIKNNNQNKKQKNSKAYHKKTNYIKNNYNNTIIPKNKINFINSDNNNSEIRDNIFLSNTNTKAKSRQRTSSTSNLDIYHNNKVCREKIYSKKIVQRSQSGAKSNINKYDTQIFSEKRSNIISNNIIPNNNIFSATSPNNIPRKTDFPMQNEMFLETDNDNESVEEEESIIRENSEGNTPKTAINLKNLKTIKINPLEDSKDKKNPYSQIDSYVSAIHKSDQGITESDGYIYEDGLLIIEPSIDISKIEDTFSEQSQSQTENESFGNEETNQKKEQKEKKEKDDLFTFLKKIGMEEYNNLLINEGFDDINLIISQMKTGLPITDDALREIGIEKPGDRAKILIRVQEVSKMFDFKFPFEAVYYKNIKQFDSLKYDFHVKAMQNWLKKLQLQNYLKNFYDNGYYSPELIFIQKASKFPINETILERDLKIENANDRKLIMNSISSNSKSYAAELQKKSTKNKNNTNKNGDNNTKNKEKDENKCTIF